MSASTAARRARQSAPSCRAEAVLEQVRQYDRVALVLQGGGALGAYQCGVYQALNEAGIRPN